MKGVVATALRTLAAMLEGLSDRSNSLAYRLYRWANALAPRWRPDSGQHTCMITDLASAVSVRDSVMRSDTVPHGFAQTLDIRGAVGAVEGWRQGVSDEPLVGLHCPLPPPAAAAGSDNNAAHSDDTGGAGGGEG